MADEARLSATDEPTVQFPDDILIEILLRLPVRSLLLFKLVSKHWLRLIKNPNFIHLHINRPVDDDSRSYYPMLILRRNLVVTLLSDDETLPYRDDVALKVLFPSLNFSGTLKLLKLLGPCKGLFCITDMTESLILNPATKKCRKVPPSPSTLSHEKISYNRYDGRITYVGFGYDPVSYDYKLVKIDERLDTDSDPYHLDMRVEIYSLRSNRWRDINRVVIPELYDEYPSRDYNAYVNGALHWLYNEKILVFDLHKEDFVWFDMPCMYDNWDFDPSIYNEDWDFGDLLWVWNESLAWIRHWDWDWDGAGEKGKFEIRVMLEYGVSSSWTKLYDIMLDVGISRTLSFNNKGEFILEIRDGKLASFDVETKAIKLFNVETRTVVNAFRYRESFVSLM